MPDKKLLDQLRARGYEVEHPLNDALAPPGEPPVPDESVLQITGPGLDVTLPATGADDDWTHYASTEFLDGHEEAIRPPTEAEIEAAQAETESATATLEERVSAIEARLA